MQKSPRNIVRIDFKISFSLPTLISSPSPSVIIAEGPGRSVLTGGVLHAIDSIITLGWPSSAPLFVGKANTFAIL